VELCLIAGDSPPALEIKAGPLHSNISTTFIPNMNPNELSKHDLGYMTVVYRPDFDLDNGYAFCGVVKMKFNESSEYIVNKKELLFIVALLEVDPHPEHTQFLKITLTYPSEDPITAVPGGGSETTSSSQRKCIYYANTKQSLN